MSRILTPSNSLTFGQNWSNRDMYFGRDFSDVGRVCARHLACGDTFDICSIVLKVWSQNISVSFPADTFVQLKLNISDWDYDNDVTSNNASRQLTASYFPTEDVYKHSLCEILVNYVVLWPTNAQLFHKLSHCYVFRYCRVILRQLETNTVPSYTSISNAAVGNTIYN